MAWTPDKGEEYLREKFHFRTIQRFSDPQRAVNRMKRIWEDGCARILKAAAELKEGVPPEEVEPSGCYPFLAVPVHTAPPIEEEMLPYGVCHLPGLYIVTATQLPMFERYWLEQIKLLIRHHGPVLVGISDHEIPLKYVPGSDAVALSSDVQRHFQAVNPIKIGDSNRFPQSEVHALGHFSAEQTDYWLSMGRHHMGSARRPQDFIILANYSFYTQMFAQFAQSEEAKKLGYTTFTPAEMSQVGSAQIPPQMPAYHLEHESGYGVTLVQIGVGAPNALTISKELAVHRPHGVILAGHTGSMRRELASGGYVLGESFYRDTLFYNDEVPMDVPIPHTREFSTEIRQAVMEVLGIDKGQLKSILHTGTVASTMRRDWELERKVRRRLIKSRPVCVEMEAAYLMAAMFDMAVPAAVFLCASDSPLFGHVKEHNSSRQMYGEKTMQHLMITIRAIDGLRKRVLDAGENPPSTQSRKLRGFGVAPLR
jgi:AMP nucleosidase